MVLLSPIERSYGYNFGPNQFLVVPKAARFIYFFQKKLESWDVSMAATFSNLQNKTHLHVPLGCHFAICFMLFPLLRTCSHNFISQDNE